jgi:hypothetical protein
MALVQSQQFTDKETPLFMRGFLLCSGICANSVLRSAYELPQHAASTTVVDRRSGAGSHVCGSGSEVHGIDGVFAIGTSAADAQRRAILARAGG